jgi:hypothetical protein
VIQRVAKLGPFLVVLSVWVWPVHLCAQVLLGRDQLDQLVARIALYPDGLLAQVLAASTYPEQIQEAAQWADEHSYLNGDALAAAISEDNLSWDPSVLALLPFPSVLDKMSSDMPWTRQLGDAVLSQRADVMDAVQRERQTARTFGYLQDCPQYHVVVDGSGRAPRSEADEAPEQGGAAQRGEERKVRTATVFCENSHTGQRVASEDLDISA